MVKISIPESFQRVLIGMVFGFVLGVVLYQSSRVQMNTPTLLQAQTPTTTIPAGVIPPISSACAEGPVGGCNSCIITYQFANCTTTPMPCCGPSSTISSIASSYLPCDPLGGSACSTGSSSSLPPPPPSSGSSSSAPQCCNAGGTCQAM